MMKNLGNIMKQAQQMQAQMADMQNRLASQEFVGIASNGAVSVTMTGDGTCKSVTISPSLLSADEQEILQDLICIAFNHARQQVEDAKNSEQQKMLGGLPLPPGLKLPF